MIYLKFIKKYITTKIVTKSIKLLRSIASTISTNLRPTCLLTFFFLCYIFNITTTNIIAADNSVTSSIDKLDKINNNKILIQESPIINNIQLQGRVMPLDTVDIIAPSNAKIDQILVQLGQKVSKKDTLMRLRSEQLDIDIRNAKETYIRAQIDYNKKQYWLNSGDVFQAKQSNIKSKLSSKRAYETYKQNRTLYKQGIISLNELEQSEVTYKDSELNLELSGRHLEEIINQGDKTHLDLLNLALENAQAKLDILENIKKQLTILSPIDGVILRANNKDKKTKINGFLSAGKNIVAGENLLAIGNLNGFAVNVYANEQIIQNITLNQKVNITIPALNKNNSFIGNVIAIDAQPSDTDSNSSPPKYFIKIIADYNNSRDKIYLGMTAKINFNLIENPKSILIPFTSIAYTDDNQPYVILNNKDNNTTKQKIKLGKTTRDKIEVTSGLKSGDYIQKYAS